jgi:hypothetical protein
MKDGRYLTMAICPLCRGSVALRCYFGFVTTNVIRYRTATPRPRRHECHRVVMRIGYALAHGK